ncbi:M56 family metallopeptidase [Spirosoma fluminis]
MEALRYVVLVNSLLAVVSIAFYCLLRRETCFGANRLALWVGLAGAVLLPLLELPDWRPQPVRTVMEQTAQVIVPRILPASPAPPDVLITFPNGQTYPALRTAPSPTFDWNWQNVLRIIYASGFLILLVRLMVQLVALFRLINRSDQEAYDQFTLVKSEHVASPFSFFSWVVLNPSQHTTHEFEQILRHERVHVRKWHSLDMVVVEIVSIVFWFNPAAFLFKSLLLQTLEFSADRTVLAEGVDSKAYQYNLLKVSQLTRQPGLAVNFGRSNLRQRISMMNRRRSHGWAYARYGLWAVVIGLMVLACRHTDNNLRLVDQVPKPNALPATTPTRALVVGLEDKGAWYCQMALFEIKHQVHIIQYKPILLHVKGDRLIVPDDYTYSVAVYINGKKASPESLTLLSPEFVKELFVMHQWEHESTIDTQAKPYQIFIQTNPKAITFDPRRRQFFTLLQAAAISRHPFGETSSFNMNQLLEATFFHNPDALVERTKNEHLKVYDEFSKDTDIFINNLPATPADVLTVHVREVAHLYTRERPYTDWFRADHPLRRFELHIQTAPKRAKRDSSYYVFSPFYTGDF